MSVTHKISRRKVIRFVVVAVLVLLCAGLMIAAATHPSGQKVQDIDVRSAEGNQPLFKKDIAEHARLIIGTLGAGQALDLEYIEQELEKDPWIANAEVFIDNKQTLRLEILERKPIARIFAINDKSYYLDSAGILLPADQVTPVNVPVFTQVPYLGEDEASVHLAKSIAYLGGLIAADPFWNAQITQVQVLPNGSFELATMVGNHKVVFGDTARAADKLYNLMVFYQKALKKIGWNKYSTVDLRYAGQVVASPAMGYAAPIVEDTAVALPDPDENEISVKAPTALEVERPEVKTETTATPVASPAPKPAGNTTANSAVKEAKKKEQPSKPKDKTKEKQNNNNKTAEKSKKKEQPSTQKQKTTNNKPKDKSQYLLPKKN